MKTALTVLFIIICIAMVVLVTVQEGKEAGLGSLAGGMSDTYWGKNKGKSLEGKLIKATTVCGILFFVVAVALCLVL